MAIGLFGRRMTRQAPPPMEPAKPMDQYDPLGQGLQRPRGLFGRLGNALQSVDWEAVGAAMRDDPSILQNLQGQRNERRLLDFRVRGAKLEDLQAQQEEEALARARQAIPENLRDVAPLLTPEAISRAVMPQEPPEWQTLDPSQLPPGARFGQRNARTGQVDMEWAPQGAGGSQPPSGYRFTADNALEPIPGGPADIRANEAGRAQAARLRSSEASLENAVGVLERALGQVSSGTAGVFANRTRELGLNQGSTDLNEALEPVRAILSFETLAEMRRNSETGGALGSIAVRELQLLGNTVRSLEVSQSPAQLRRNIAETRAQLARTLQAVRAARGELEQDAQPQATAPSNGPRPGTVEDGYRFRGGDPADPNNWEPVR